MRNSTLGIAGLSALIVAFVFLPCLAAQPGASDNSPESLRQRRLDLLLKASKTPLSQFAGEIDDFAVDSEACRAAEGSKTCGLPAEILRSGKLDQVFNYYVKMPAVTAISNATKPPAKENWTWKPKPAAASTVP